MKDLYTAGEVASLFDLNVQTLHYYESIGLLAPVRKRENTGTRMYVFDQVYKLASIRFLKRLNYPLKRIRELMDTRESEHSLAQMEEQSNELEKQLEDLRKIKEAIDRKIRFVRERSADLRAEMIEARSFPERRYLPIGFEEALYRNDSFYFYPTVVFYEKAGKRFGALLAEGEPAPEGTVPLSIPAGSFLCAYHQGPYDRIGETQLRLEAEAAARGLRVGNESVHVNILDQFVERDARRFLTEVEMRIES